MGGGGTNNQKKINWVYCNKIVSPKSANGLGIGSLRSFNISLITKWRWRYRSEPNCMWSKIIQGIDNLKYKHVDCIAKKSICGVWKNIENIKGELERLGKPMGNVMRKQVNDGKSTFFGWMAGVEKEASKQHSQRYTP